MVLSLFSFVRFRSYVSQKSGYSLAYLSRFYGSLLPPKASKLCYLREKTVNILALRPAGTRPSAAGTRPRAPAPAPAASRTRPPAPAVPSPCGRASPPFPSPSARVSPAPHAPSAPIQANRDF
jgi:hypothetical protein